VSGAATASRPAKLAGDAKIVVKRVLPAKREVIFALWTDPTQMPRWILDGGSATLDVRVGGKYHLDMHYQGKSYPHEGEYLEIVPPERLVFTWLSQSTNWQPTIVTLELRAVGDKTEAILTHEGLPDAKSAADHRGGWEEILAWLEDKML
jgi:uncharacterized protein YndB with AHSA1/START domain